LSFQSAGIVFLTVSYLFNEAFFAMLGLLLALTRTLVYYSYERKEKVVPLWLGIAFALVTLFAYFLVNVWILNDWKRIDILCVIALALYALVLRVPDLKKVRYLVLLPTALSVVYNAFAGSAVFVTFSYSFELMMNVLAIVKYEILHKEKNGVFR